MPSPSAASRTSAQPLDEEHDLQLVVIGRHTAADGVVVLELADRSGADLPTWSPGAHVDLVLTNELTRQYSLCGDPADRAFWRVAVLREPESRGGSAHVHDALYPEFEVAGRGPRNHFRLEPAPGYVFLAGGIGITPMLPMIRAASAAGAAWTLHYGGRSRSSMAFLEELAAYGDRVRPLAQDEVGLPDIDAALAEAGPGALVYTCGPACLLDAVEQAGDRRAMTVHLECFTPKEVGAPARSDAFEVHLAQSGLTLTVPPDRSILDVVEEAGIELLTSAGRAPAGLARPRSSRTPPEHRDSLLSEDVKDAMMICVSRAACRRLVLDL